MESAKPLMEALVQGITDVQVVSLHHDISTVTGEAFIVITLDGTPSYRAANKTEPRSGAGGRR